VQLSINNREFDDISIVELRQQLDRFDQETFCEIWLSQVDGASISCLKSADRCFLVYLRWMEDAGFSTRNDKVAESSIRVKFRLANGQIDEYPEAWTVTYEQGKKALEYFHLMAEMDESLDWHKE
jgi:hypothetical protein